MLSFCYRASERQGSCNADVNVWGYDLIGCRVELPWHLVRFCTRCFGGFLLLLQNSACQGSNTFFIALHCASLFVRSVSRLGMSLSLFILRSKGIHKGLDPLFELSICNSSGIRISGLHEVPMRKTLPGLLNPNP